MQILLSSRIFSFPLSEGDISTVLNAPNKIVITQSTAKKYFGGEEPVGKTLKVGDLDFEVTGVMADIPSNSQIRFDLVASFSSLDYAQAGKMDGGQLCDLSFAGQ